MWSGTYCDYAIKAGKHVFVTKPMGMRVDKRDVAKEAGVILAVNFGLRYEEINRKIKLALDDGRLERLILNDVRVKWYRTQEYYDGGFPLVGGKGRKLKELSCKPSCSSHRSYSKVLVYKCKDDPEASLDEFKLDPNRPKNIIEDMVSAIKRGTPVMVDGNEGRKSVAIFNAICKSSETGEGNGVIT